MRCERAEPARGTWTRYDGREGVVVSVNRERFPNGETYCEVGVNFGTGHNADGWFRADELTPASERIGAPGLRQRDETGSDASTPPEIEPTP